MYDNKSKDPKSAAVQELICAMRDQMAELGEKLGVPEEATAEGMEEGEGLGEEAGALAELEESGAGESPGKPDPSVDADMEKLFGFKRKPKMG